MFIREPAISVYIVIGTYNECENIRPLVKKIFEHAPDVNLLFVDDNSPDGTGGIIDELAASDDRIEVIHRPGKMGLGSAYRQAFKYLLAEKDPEYIFELDADFSHDPAAIPRFLNKARRGYDLVIGARYVPGGSTPTWNAFRKFISWTANIYTRLLLGWKIHDYTTGYRCYRASALRRFDLDEIKSEGYSFQVEMAFTFQQAGCRIGEVPIRFIDRSYGKSKFSRKILLEAIFRVMIFAAHRFVHFFGWRPG